MDDLLLIDATFVDFVSELKQPVWRHHGYPRSWHITF
jgi:hypothetical protein